MNEKIRKTYRERNERTRNIIGIAHYNYGFDRAIAERDYSKYRICKYSCYLFGLISIILGFYSLFAVLLQIVLTIEFNDVIKITKDIQKGVINYQTGGIILAAIIILWLNEKLKDSFLTWFFTEILETKKVHYLYLFCVLLFCGSSLYFSQDGAMTQAKVTTKKNEPINLENIYREQQSAFSTAQTMANNKGIGYRERLENKRSLSTLTESNTEALKILSEANKGAISEYKENVKSKGNVLLLICLFTEFGKIICIWLREKFLFDVESETQNDKEGKDYIKKIDGERYVYKRSRKKEAVYNNAFNKGAKNVERSKLKGRDSALKSISAYKTRILNKKGNEAHNKNRMKYWEAVLQKCEDEKENKVQFPDFKDWKILFFIPPYIDPYIGAIIFVVFAHHGYKLLKKNGKI